MTARRNIVAQLGLVLASLCLAADGPRAPAPPPRVPTGETIRGERYALLVGVQEYEGELAALRYAEADVLGLAEVLKGPLQVPADHLVVMTQQGNTSFRRTPTRSHILEQLDLLLSGLREQDTLVVALVGQGIQRVNDSDPLFCPIDARPGDPGTLLSLAEVRRRMEPSRAGLKLLLYGASRIDFQIGAPRAAAPPAPVPVPAAGRATAAAASPSAAPAPAPEVRPVITLYGCGRGERAFEDDESRHGIFFRYLIDGLGGKADADEDGLGTLAELENYVVRNVRNQVRAQYAVLQQPELAGCAAPAEIAIAFKPVGLLLKRARELLDRRRYDEAIADATRVLQFDPRLAEAYHLRGKARVLDNRDDTAAALADFTAAIQVASNFGEAYFDRGLLYLDSGVPASAVADFDQAVRAGKSGRDVLFYRGMAYLQQDRFTEAIADLSGAIKADPGFAAAYLNRGAARFRLDLNKEAQADYDQAIALDPRLARAYLNRGVLRLRRGDLDGAINDFDAAIQQAHRTGDQSSLAPAYFDRGKAFYLKKDFARAIDDWERITRNFDDRDSMTLDFLGMAYSQLQNEARATRYFEDAVRLDDNRSYAPAHAHLGATRYNQKDFDAAIKECTTAIEIDRSLAEAYVTRSLAYRALKQLDRARADQEQAVQLRNARPSGPRLTDTRQK